MEAQLDDQATRFLTESPSKNRVDTVERVVHLLGGVSLILDTRVREKLDWVHLLWTANVFVPTLLVWWFNFALTEVQVWTLPHFLNLVAYTVGPPG